MKMYSVLAYNFEKHEPFEDSMNTETNDLKRAKTLAKKQAKQWCETKYGDKLITIDLGERRNKTKTTMQYIGGKWKPKPLANFYIEGYVCETSIWFGSVIRKNY